MASYRTSAKLVLCVEKIQRLGSSVYAEGTVEKHLLVGGVEHVHFMVCDGQVTLVKKHITSLKQGFKKERFFTATRTCFDKLLSAFVAKQIAEMSVKLKPSNEKKFRQASMDACLTKNLSTFAPKATKEWGKDQRWGNEEATKHRKDNRVLKGAVGNAKLSFGELMAKAKAELAAVSH